MTDSNNSVHEPGRIEVRSLKIENFKGCARFELVPPPDGIALVGDNATGKTTIADAFAWTLFGVDLAGNAKFNVLTLDAHGTPVHGLDASVEIRFNLPHGERLTLKRLHRETWTKRRGSTTATRTGHTTKLWINKVPTKASDYADEVEELLLCNAPLFRALTDPMHVARMHWRDRRELLLGLAGEVTLDDVVGADPELVDLPGVLEGHEPEDARKVWSERRRAHNTEISRIPPAIVEREGDRQEVDDPRVVAVLNSDRDCLIAKVADLQERKAQVAAGGEIASKRVELATARAEILDAEREDRTRRRAAVEQLQEECYAALESRGGRRLQVTTTAASTVRISTAAHDAIDRGHRGYTRSEWDTINRHAPGGS